MARLMSEPGDFTMDELETLMLHCGCQKNHRGKTSGSAIAYVHQESGRVFKAHSPHPGNVLKHYQVAAVIDFLRSIGAVG